MGMPRFSTRAILFVVLLIAANCAALRIIFGGTADFRLVIGLFGILPTTNLLAVACYRDVFTDEGSRSPIALCLSGGITITIYTITCFIMKEESLMSVLEWSVRWAENLRLVRWVGSGIGGGTNRLIYYHAIRLSFLATLTTLPLLTSTILGGRLIRGLMGRFREA